MELKMELLAYMKPGETVAQAMRRNGSGARKRNKGEKLKANTSGSSDGNLKGKGKGGSGDIAGSDVEGE